MTATDVLFRPFALKGLNLANRIVMAPMTRGMAEGGVPGAKQAEYYRRRAEGGVGQPAKRHDRAHLQGPMNLAVLRQIGDVTRKLLPGPGVDRPALHCHGARRRLQQTRQHFHGRRLAGPVGADDADAAAGVRAQ